MKIYILMIQYDYEDSYREGIYNSLNEAVNKAEALASGDRYTVVCYNLIDDKWISDDHWVWRRGTPLVGWLYYPVNRKDNDKSYNHS